MAGTSQRTVQEVEQLIEKAKIDEKDLTKETQTLLCDFGHADSDALILFELSPALAQSLIIGEEFVIRGDENESAVFCTKSATYDIKQAETSNSLLVLPEFSLPNNVKEPCSMERRVIERKVLNIFHHYGEIKKCQPRLQKLRYLLEENPYSGPEYEQDNHGSKYTLENLLSQIQASEKELHGALNRLPAFHVDGYYRVLEFDYKCQVVNLILNVIDSNSYPIDEIPKSDVIDTLNELVPKNICEQCFDIYAERKTDLYELKEDKVCQFFAEILLRSSGKFHLQEFLESWQKSVPDGLTTSLSHLEGIALTDRQCKPEIIFYYPVSSLPEQINERFEALFRKRPKWTFSDIEPYIKDLATESQNVNALLTKHARASMQNGIKMYNSKHPLK